MLLLGSALAATRRTFLAGSEQAASQKMKTIGLCGNDGGELAKACDIAIVIPSTRTAQIQECHITVGHIVCELMEAAPGDESQELSKI
jgi:D-sedoheptulose 7-phosphate isomerase